MKREILMDKIHKVGEVLVERGYMEKKRTPKKKMGTMKRIRKNLGSIIKKGAK